VRYPYTPVACRDALSFPTRRSSDLEGCLACPLAAREDDPLLPFEDAGDDPVLGVFLVEHVGEHRCVESSSRGLANVLEVALDGGERIGEVALGCVVHEP